ncbi:MAG TPA: hypothetical protein VKC53_00120 [Patescibacteria group bacterium]|nr:hypothetical protein [Patescibacteria group bacterium]
MSIEFDVSVRVECVPGVTCDYVASCPLIKNRVIGNFDISERIAGHEEVKYRKSISSAMVARVVLEPCTRADNPLKGGPVKIKLANHPVIYTRIDPVAAAT